ncbi:hypothetical protein GCM10023149_12540 [Mucilaginibacter gynuensis]|uniref:Lipoprotein with Yx(FWY)xxD motif n=1 Tax=Mucilaginibacter gynuensis TaxID=1302236 RepID=A0ABP8G243_9SPHI
MKSTHHKLMIAAIAAVIISFASACKKDSNNTDNTKPDEPTTVTGVKLTQNATFGNIITDSKGRSLYFFAIDADGNSNCNGQCAVVWPVFYKENPEMGTGLNAADFAVITRTDGSKQTTYKGWPLYYYQSDSQANDVKGDKVGNTWFVAKADYTVMLANKQLVGHDGVNYNGQSQPATEVTQYITDANGQTLYDFAPDKFKKNNFTKPDFSNNAVWPIYEVATVGSIPSILDKTQFDVIDVFGKSQLVYKGHPLYHFGTDAGVRGNTKGVSFPTPGVWKITNSTTVDAPAN